MSVVGEDMPNITDKVVAITGASSGIGEVVVRPSGSREVAGARGRPTRRVVPNNR